MAGCSSLKMGDRPEKAGAGGRGSRQEAGAAGQEQAAAGSWQLAGVGIIGQLSIASSQIIIFAGRRRRVS